MDKDGHKIWETVKVMGGWKAYCAELHGEEHDALEQDDMVDPAEQDGEPDILK